MGACTKFGTIVFQHHVRGVRLGERVAAEPNKTLTSVVSHDGRLDERLERLLVLVQQLEVRVDLLERGARPERSLEGLPGDLAACGNVTAAGRDAGAGLVDLIARVRVVQRAHHAIAEEHVVDARQRTRVLAIVD